MEDLEGKTNWEIRAEKRIEKVLNQPDPVSGIVFCEGEVPYCVYYSVSNCPRTCAYALERMKAEEDAEAHRAMSAGQ